MTQTQNNQNELYKNATSTMHNVISKINNEFTTVQKVKVGEIYCVMAEMLPVEGRDFVLDFEFKDNINPTVKFIPYTEIGKLWCEYLKTNMAAFIAKKQTEQKEIADDKPDR